MNKSKIIGLIDRIENATFHIGMIDLVPATKIQADVRAIRAELYEDGDSGWRLRSDPPVKQGQRCLCRFVYEIDPERPFYMVLSWNECCEVPHFDNEVDGVMRVTHWAEIFEPETGERLEVG